SRNLLAVDRGTSIVLSLFILHHIQKTYVRYLPGISAMIKFTVRIFFFSLVAITTSQVALGQAIFEFDQSIEVVEHGESLELAWAGGLNSSQYHSIDLNFDGTDDLVIFDRTSNKLSCFLWLDDHYEY